ncbi:MAG: hypothetical protein VX072_08260, partial [Pseudomonadota bacterium]|nr:hypothetical protein [Pseudomonadota bacterium]
TRMSAETPPQVEADLDAIAPAEITLARSAQTPPAETALAPARVPVPLFVGGVLLLMLALVVFLLPRMVDDASSADRRSTGDAQGAEAAAVDAGPGTAPIGDEAAVAPFEAMELERERLAAQEILEQMLARMETLEDRAVELWGAEALTKSRAMAEAGDDAFLAQEYEAAQTLYADALTALDALIARGEALYLEQLTRAQAAIEAGEVSAAMTALEFVRAVDPERPDAARAWARASVLAEVLDLVGEARAVASDGAIAAARSLVSEALSLDAETKQEVRQLAETARQDVTAAGQVAASANLDASKAARRHFAHGEHGENRMG